MLINWVTFANNLFQWLLTDYECSSWCQAIFQKLRTMNHRTASFNFKQLFKVQLIALTVSWATYHSQSVPMAFSRLYMFLSDSNNFFRNQEQYAQCPERTDLFSIEQIYFFAVLSIMQKRNCREWERMNTSSYTGSLNLSYIQSSPTTGGNH